MGVTVEVDDTTNLVTSAKCSAVMFRGFETIVLGRDPRDCAPILSAICGVCHSDHHINSVRAIENAAGMTSYPGGYAYEQTTIPAERRPEQEHHTGRRLVVLARRPSPRPGGA